MKVLATFLAVCLPVIALAQAPAPAKPARNSGLAPSAQKAVEERTRIEDEPMHELSPIELEIAGPCTWALSAASWGPPSPSPRAGARASSS